MARRHLDRDWLAAPTASALLSLLYPDHRTPETWSVRRKLRLVLCGAARTVWERLPDDDLRTAVAIAERFADGRASKSELDEGHRLALRRAAQYRRVVADTSQRWPPDPPTVAEMAGGQYAAAAAGLVEDCCERSVTVARIASRVLAEFPRLAAPPSAWEAAPFAGWEGVEVGPDPSAAVVRDVFGPPTAPPFPVGWKTATVTALATGIAADAGFDRLPVLADALEEAGCDDARVLDHCRSPGPHWRGCWVVDSILGS